MAQLLSQIVAFILMVSAFVNQDKDTAVIACLVVAGGMYLIEKPENEFVEYATYAVAIGVLLAALKALIFGW